MQYNPGRRTIYNKTVLYSIFSIGLYIGTPVISDIIVIIVCTKSLANP